MKKSTSSNLFLYLAGTLFFLLGWKLLSMRVGEETMVFPGPAKTVLEMFGLLTRGYTWKCIGMTFLRMAEGFGCSFVLALFLGTIAGYEDRLRKMLQPFIVVLRAVPTACLVYLFIVLTGYRSAPAYLVGLIAFPILNEGVASGVANVPGEFINAARVDGVNRVKECLSIRLPLAKPYIAAALFSSFSLSFKIEIMAEVITGSSDAGLGNVIRGMRAADPTNMLPVFAYSLIAVLLMLTIDLMIGICSTKKQIKDL